MLPTEEGYYIGKWRHSERVEVIYIRLQGTTLVVDAIGQQKCYSEELFRYRAWTFIKLDIESLS